jgi:hypothetical protein
MLARIVESENPAVIAAYEKKFADLENRKLILSEKPETQGNTHHAFEDMFELALSFLSNPWKLWVSGNTACAGSCCAWRFRTASTIAARTAFRTSKLPCH